MPLWNYPQDPKITSTESRLILPPESIVTFVTDAPSTVVMAPRLVTITSTSTPTTTLLPPATQPLSSTPSSYGSGCYSIPVGPNTPTGIAGCERWGNGIASHYGPGSGVAMNFCTWTFRHEHGCGSVVVKSLETGLQAMVPVVDYCDCYTGTPDERIIDLQYGVVQSLGLSMSRGLYEVEVWPAQP